MTIAKKTGVLCALCIALTATLPAQQLRRTTPSKGARNVEPELIAPAIDGSANLDTLRQKLQQQQMEALIQQARDNAEDQKRDKNDDNQKKSGDFDHASGKLSPEIQTAVIRKQTESYLNDLPPSAITPGLKALGYFAIDLPEKAMPFAATWAKQSPSVLGQTLLWELSKHFDLSDQQALIADGLARQWALTGTGLKLKRASLVSRIQGFGLYDPIIVPLSPGQHVMAYSELHNFDLQLKGDAYQVTLNIGAEIKTSDGLRLWHNPSTWRGKLSYRSPIRDLFLNTRLTIPDNVHRGNDYIVTLTVKDEIKNQTVSADIPFTAK